MKAKFLVYCALSIVVMVNAGIGKTAYSQVDSTALDYRKEFDKFKQSTQDQFDQFRKKNDSIFISFLKESWKTFDAFQSEIPVINKPKEQPVLNSIMIYDGKIEPGDVIPPEVITPEPDELPARPAEKLKVPGTTFNFYDIPVEMMKGNDPLPSIKALSPDIFIEFYKQAMISPTIEYNATHLYEEALRLGLNDWGLVQLLKKAAGNLFKNENEQVLFIWFSLLRNGYDVKTGYYLDKIYLLVPSKQEIYKTVYVPIGDKLYYLLKFDKEDVKIEKMDSYSRDYPGNETRFSLLSKRLPSFPSKPIKKTIFAKDSLNILLDKNILEYISSIPPCELSVPFSTPLSGLAESSLERALHDKLQGKTEKEIVNFLLKLLQNGFPYMNDIDQFGYEKFMFAEQALFYPYTDCDDRAILLARLIHKFTSCKVCGMQFTDHVALGVCFKEPPGNGVYAEHAGVRYYYCDPTYIGADIGMIPERYKNARPALIFFEK